MTQLSPKFSKHLVKRKWTRKSANGQVLQVIKYPGWYGRHKGDDGKWRWIKFYADRRASEKSWEEFKTTTERRAAGVITPEIDAAGIGLESHLKEYLESLRLRKVADETWRISKFILNRGLELTGWKMLSQITASSFRSSVLAVMDAELAAAEYQNKFIIRWKAFLNWLMSEQRLLNNPLRTVCCVNPRRGIRRRDRRAGTDQEIQSLLEAAPKSRRVVYSIALFAGLRRREIALIRPSDICLDDPFPHLRLRREQTKNGMASILPIHPYLAVQLREQTPHSDTVFFGSVPDMKTFVKDLEKAKIVFANDFGERLDFHALRHTFCTNLDSTGCSPTVKRMLMRHISQSVTDGYCHAHLSELTQAIKRLRCPPSLGAICPMPPIPRDIEQFIDDGFKMTVQSGKDSSAQQIVLTLDVFAGEPLKLYNHLWYAHSRGVGVILAREVSR